MENTLYFSKNLKHLRRQNQRQTQDALALVLGLTRSVISSYEDGRAEPNISTLTKISEYFGVSIENLTNLDLANVDEKEIEHKRELSQYASGRRLRLVSVKSVPTLGKQVSLVPQKASAGYTRGFGDDKYLQNLPHYQLPFLEKSRQYRAFEISGDSMLPLPDKSIVIGEWVEKFEEVRDGHSYIVVSDSDGIVFKKLYNKIGERGTLLLKSTNLAYEPYEIPVSDIREIWRFTAFISRDFPEEYDPADHLKQAFERIEHEIQDLKMHQEA